MSEVEWSARVEDAPYQRIAYTNLPGKKAVLTVWLGYDMNPWRRMPEIETSVIDFRPKIFETRLLVAGSRWSYLLDLASGCFRDGSGPRSARPSPATMKSAMPIATTDVGAGGIYRGCLARNWSGSFCGEQDRHRISSRMRFDGSRGLEDQAALFRVGRFRKVERT
jgi:hypothetical protein